MISEDFEVFDITTPALVKPSVRSWDETRTEAERTRVAAHSTEPFEPLELIQIVGSAAGEPA